MPAYPTILNSGTTAQNQAFAGATGGQLDEVTQIVEAFLQSVGFVSGIDAEQLAGQLYGSGLYTNVESAYQYLFSQLPQGLQQQFPGAAYGMDPISYQQSVENYGDMFYDLTGQQISAPVLGQAIREKWSSGHLSDYLLKSGAATGDLSFLQAGETYRGLESQYAAQYGHAPDSPSTLTAWWKFNVSARTVGSGAPAQVADKAPTGQSEVR